MLKLLLFVGVLVGVYYVFFAKKKILNGPRNDASMDEAMIPCATCGIYVQAKDTLMSAGKHYCSSECMEKK